jgi:putative DNA primase/helicase
VKDQEESDLKSYDGEDLEDDEDVDTKGNSPETAAKVRDALDDCRKRMAYTSTKGGGSKIKNDELNLAVILAYDPRWKGVFAYDEFAQALHFTREPPWHPDDAPQDKSLVWGDHHVNPLNLWLRRNWGLELSNEKIRDTVYTVARRHGCNPLTTYLDSLTWDGVERIDTWLSFYLGVENNPYSRAVGRKWLISAVARAFHPGSKVDTVLILEGPQGEGKSTALRVLGTGRPSEGGPQRTWFSDSPIPIGDKDAFVNMRGKWIYEMPELASMKKADLDKVKAFLSAPTDSYRPPYGREQVTVPRTCVFAGTVNLGEYLHDSTGARRFWPVKIGVIDIGALTDDRDQLWAEAVAVYKAWVKRGMPQSECLWWPSPEERSVFEKEQSDREVTHPWNERIASWLQCGRARELTKVKGYLLTSEIATHALDIADKDLDVPNATMIGVIMTREVKWTKRRFMLNRARVYGYVPPADY